MPELESGWVAAIAADGGAEAATRLLEIASAGLAAIGDTVLEVGDWFTSDPIAGFKILGVGFALVAFVPNWRALVGVRDTIISCERPLNFQGLRIGSSVPFVIPMRELLFSYALYLFYQTVSQAMGLFGDGSVRNFLIDVVAQVALFALVGSQFLKMRMLAKRLYQEQGQHLDRFLRTFDKALHNQKLSMTGLAISTFVLPIAALAPKAIELAAK